MLVADSPTGPFKDPIGGVLVDKSVPNCEDVVWMFDPAVLVDDDGTGYLYFAGDPVAIDAPYIFEDSGIHKYKDKYYYGFHNAEIVSMVSDNPMGPFEFKEVNMEEGVFVRVRGVDFGETSPSKFTAMIKAAAGASGAIRIRIDGLDGEVGGYLPVDRLTGVEYEAYTSALDTTVTWVHDLYFIYVGDNYRVMSWKFEK